KKRIGTFLAVAIAAGVLVVAVRRTHRQDAPLLDGSTITVVPGIHLPGGVGPAAAYPIETPHGLLLTDYGLDRDGRSLKAELAKLGVDWAKLHGIFLTHVHGDHSGGADQLRAATGATVYAGRADAPVLRAGAPREAFYSIYDMPDQSPHTTTID